MANLEQNSAVGACEWPLTRPDIVTVCGWIRSVIGSACTISGLTRIYAQYTDAPDIRVTARFATGPESGQDVVFKANLFPLLASSPRCFDVVSRHCPGAVPHVLAWEAWEGGSFLLYEAFAGEPVADLNSPDSLLATARTLAGVQAQIAGLNDAETASIARLEVDRLPTLFGDLLARLRSHYDAAWAADDTKLSRLLDFPASQILAHLEPLAPEVMTWAQELTASPIPLSVDHGNLHTGNAVRRPDGSILIFDWENACLSCPLFSVEKLLVSAWAVDTRPDEAGPWGWVHGTPTQLAVKQAYLDAVPWGSRKQRNRLFDIAMCLAVIKEIHQEIEWAETMNWTDGNPEWTAQLVSRLFQHSKYIVAIG